MNDEKRWWHFYCWAEFNNRVFHKTITQSDIISKRFFVEEVKQLSGTDIEEVPVSQVCYKVEKNKEMFILPEKYVSELPINATKYLECYLKESDKTIYKLITGVDSARILPKKTLSFKQFIDGFNPIDHSQPRIATFFKLVMVASKHKPVKIQLCSPTASGKNMNFTVLQYITNDIATLGNTTLAKLESLLHYYKTLIFTELTSLTSAEVRMLEPAFSMLADNSPVIHKHSIALSKEMSRMELRNTSIIFTYNRPCDLQPDAKFFSQIWQNPSAINSRYPALLLDGKVLSRMVNPSPAETKRLVDEHWKDMVGVAENSIYFFQNLERELHSFTQRKVLLEDDRQYPNIHSIVEVLNAYSDSQGEFDEWIDWLNGRLNAFRNMNVDERKTARVEVQEKIVEEIVADKNDGVDNVIQAYNELCRMDRVNGYKDGAVEIIRLEKKLGRNIDADVEHLLKNGDFFESSKGFIKRL